MEAEKAAGKLPPNLEGWEQDRNSETVSSIFAQLNAFVQRCKDLQEVCEGLTQFCRRTAGGGSLPLPDFGGSRGAEVGTSLLSIETQFGKLVALLRGVQYDILDVKATATLWHTDYNTTFKSGMKDLEVMMMAKRDHTFYSRTSLLTPLLPISLLR